MIDLELKPLRKGRVWIDEALPATFEFQKLHEQFIDSGAISKGKQYLFAIELQMIRGSRPVYGLLGATFAPDQSHNLRIQAGVGEEELPESVKLLVSGPEVVQLGLPEEYIHPILNAASQMQQKARCLPSGRLIFNCGIHGVFSSNSAIFSFLSESITAAVGMLCREIKEKDVLEFITSKINDF